VDIHLNVKAFRGQPPLPPVALQTSPLSSSWAPRSGQVLGYANITSLLAYYQQARKYGVNPYSATLQLNVVLQVNTTSGTYAPGSRTCRASRPTRARKYGVNPYSATLQLLTSSPRRLVPLPEPSTPLNLDLTN